MLRLVLFRCLGAVPVLLAVVMLTFVLFEVVPGDAALVALGDRATPEQLAAARHEMGLDAPAGARLLTFLTRLGAGDLGRSLRSGRPVRAEIADRLPYTLLLTGAAVGAAALAGLVAGALGAGWRGRWLDALLTAAAALLLATPVFALALPLVSLLSVKLGLLPVAGAEGWRHLVLPAITLALPSAAAVARVARAAFVDVLQADYVRTARAKGLSPAALYARHVWPNAAPPVLALLGVHLGSLLGGAVVVETIFAWPGLGRLATQAILSRDLPLAQGVMLVLAAGFVLANLAVDVISAAIDPRLSR